MTKIDTGGTRPRLGIREQSSIWKREFSSLTQNSPSFTQCQDGTCQTGIGAHNSMTVQVFSRDPCQIGMPEDLSWRFLADQGARTFYISYKHLHPYLSISGEWHCPCYYSTRKVRKCASIQQYQPISYSEEVLSRWPWNGRDWMNTVRHGWRSTNGE